MAYLMGLQEYLDESYNTSIFDQALASEQMWILHIHKHRIVQTKVMENLKYDIRIGSEGGEGEILPKVNIKLIYPENLSESITPLLRIDKKIESLELEPILAPAKRYHVKNKSLFPLMKERKVVIVTLLEGEKIKGIIGGFNRYEIKVNLKGGIPITVLRHSIYDLRDKKGRCFLKAFQDKSKDWEKSELFV